MSATDLEHFIQHTPMVDTHEHLRSQRQWVEEGPDVLGAILSHYLSGDLRNAGASQEAIEFARDRKGRDVPQRVDAIRPAWELTAHTGYGQAARWLAREVFGIRELAADAVLAAQDQLDALRKPGQRLRLLRDVAKLDHVQIDTGPFGPDEEDADFFLHDLSWVTFAAAGETILQDAAALSGVEIKNLGALQRAMDAVFERYGATAVAVKTQHAYQRTLAWRPRGDVEAADALAKLLRGRRLDGGERNCLGDWCLGHGVQRAIEHNLPIKIHCGYYAGHSTMQMDRIRPSHLCELLIAYPEARFVLMHAGYPYVDEWIALGKHFPNAYLDLCWAWSIDPMTVSQTVRKLIHAVPANKVFVFGGDTFWPTLVCAYAAQARFWLTRALRAEIDEGLLTEAEAIGVAGRWLGDNQRACFDLDGTRAAIRTFLDRPEADASR